MPLPHRIRLRGPWDSHTDTGRTSIVMPNVVPHGAPSVSLYRRFGKPTNLDPMERVWLVCEAIQGTVTLTLNEQVLGTYAEQAALDITSYLQERNTLQATFAPTTAAVGFPGAIALEIRGT